MSDLGKFAGGVAIGFGEQFVKTLESERKRKKEEDQYNQDMAYKYRQQNLMMNYYEKQQEETRRGHDLSAFRDYGEVPEGTQGAIPGGDLKKGLGIDFFDSSKHYMPDNQIPKEEKITPKKFSKLEDLYGGKVEVQYEEGQEEPLSYGTHYKPEKANITNINMPKPEKWKDFGKLITDMKQTEVYDTKKGEVEQLQPVERKQKWELAKNTAYSNLLPNAYKWYKKEFIDRRHEDASDEWFYKKLYIALEKDELTPEEVQDLTDFNVYREDLFGKNSIYGTVVEKGKKSE